jgi:hypothetical protein
MNDFFDMVDEVSYLDNEDTVAEIEKNNKPK